MPGVIRKSHIKRCFGVIANAAGGYDVDKDTWIDIMRIDEFDFYLMANPDGAQSQGYRFILKWKDDQFSELTDDDTAGITGRKTSLGKARDPEEPFEKDPTDFVPYRVIDKLAIKDSGQVVWYVFKNKNETPEGVQVPTARAIDVIRLYHEDTTADDVLNADGGTGTVDALNYQLAGNTDQTQYTDMEVIKHWSHQLRADYQTIVVVLKNADVYETLGIVVEASISPGTNSSGDPVIAGRYDPFQNVVNAQWSGLMVEFQDLAK